MKNFYTALKAVYGPTTSSSPPLFSADGNTLILDKDKILECWAEHFDSVLNRPSNINKEAINRLPQIPIEDSLADPPTEAEVEKAIKRLSSGKAPGADSIPTEVYAAGGPKLIESLTSLLTTMWTQEKLPQELKDASIIHLYKRAVPVKGIAALHACNARLLHAHYTQCPCSAHAVSTQLPRSVYEPYTHHTRKYIKMRVITCV